MTKSADDQYSDEEATQRMNDALRQALNTRPQPQTTVRHPRQKKAKPTGADHPKRAGDAGV